MAEGCSLQLVHSLCTILGLADDEETGRSHGLTLSVLGLQSMGSLRANRLQEAWAYVLLVST